jgi:hypothetical protein
MPLFYPHLCNGDCYLADTEPEEFADEAKAHAGAIQTIRGIVASDIRRGTPINLAHFIELRDEQVTALRRIHFRDAVSIEDPDKTDNT